MQLVHEHCKPFLLESPHVCCYGWGSILAFPSRKGTLKKGNWGFHSNLHA